MQPKVYVNDTELEYETVADFHTEGKWCEDFTIGFPVYKKEYWDAPGEDGQGVKRFGYRYTPITLRLRYTNQDPITKIFDDWSAYCNAAFKLTINTKDFEVCELELDKCMISLPQAVVTAGESGGEWNILWCDVMLVIMQREL